MSDRYRIRAATAAFLLAFGAGQAGGLAAQTGAVTGAVADATTGQPLEGARVSLEGTPASALTDVGGRYLLDGVPAAAHTIRVVLAGYGTRERRVDLEAGITAEADFRLQVSGVDPDRVWQGAAGVILVTTERGRRNTPPSFTLNTGIGLNRLRANLPTRLRTGFTGPGGFAAWDPNERLIENGRVNKIGGRPGVPGRSVDDHGDRARLRAWRSSLDR